MKLLKTDEFYITKKIEEIIKTRPGPYDDLVMILNNCISSVPLLQIASSTIEDFDNLKFKLEYQESKDEFTINAYYFLIEQQQYYIDEKINNHSATEIAIEDLRGLFESYNEPAY